MEAQILDLAARLGTARIKYETLRQQLRDSYDFTRHHYNIDPADILKQLTDLNDVMLEHTTAFNALIWEYAKKVNAELDAIESAEATNAPVSNDCSDVEPYADDRELVPSLA